MYPTWFNRTTALSFLAIYVQITKSGFAGIVPTYRWSWLSLLLPTNSQIVSWVVKPTFLFVANFLILDNLLKSPPCLYRTSWIYMFIQHILCVYTLLRLLLITPTLSTLTFFFFFLIDTITNNIYMLPDTSITITLSFPCTTWLWLLLLFTHTLHDHLLWSCIWLLCWNLTIVLYSS
jgi:hypothetical protein